MTWRTVVVTNKAKLSYKNDYLIVRNDEVKLIHLSEINTLIIDTTAATMTSYLISEMLIQVNKFLNKLNGMIIVRQFGQGSLKKRLLIKRTI